MKYPLLIQGLYSNSDGVTNQTVAPAVTLTNQGWTNALQIGRGDIVAVDPVTTSAPALNSNIDLGTFSYFIGSEQVYQDEPITRHITAAVPRSYEVLQMRSKGGQSVRLAVTNDVNRAGVVMHHYFENNFATAEIIAARQESVLKQRIKTFRTTTFAAGGGGVGIYTGNNITIPTGAGNVIGIELFITRGTATESLAQNSLITLLVDGIEVFKDAASAAFLSVSGRPGLIFPILIRPGSTFRLDALNTYIPAGAAPVLTYNLRLYFDNDRSGKKQYQTNEKNMNC
jgi:hypothetical protein